MKVTVSDKQARACRSVIEQVTHDVSFDNEHGYATRTKCGVWCQATLYLVGIGPEPPDVDCMSCLVAEGRGKA